MSNLAYQTPLKPKREVEQQPKRKTLKEYGITPGEKFLVFFLLVCVAIGGIFIVSTQAKIYQVNNDIQHLKMDIEKQQKANNALDEAVVALRNPERILKIAREQGLSISGNNVKMIQQ